MAEAEKGQKSQYLTAALTIRAITLKTSTRSSSFTLFLSHTQVTKVCSNTTKPKLKKKKEIKLGSLLSLPSEVPYEDYWAVTHSCGSQAVLKKT